MSATKTSTPPCDEEQPPSAERPRAGTGEPNAGVLRSVDDALRAFDDMARRFTLMGASELDYYGQLADRLIALGRVELAADVLAPPVERAVRAASRGAVLPVELVDRLGRSFVRLAHESLDGFWFDAAVVLHFAARRLFEKDTAQHLSWLRSEGAMGDEILLEGYRKELRTAMGRMAPDDRERCEDVMRLLPSMPSACH